VVRCEYFRANNGNSFNLLEPWYGTAQFLQTGFSSQSTATGENVVLSGYFDKPGNATLNLAFFDNLGNGECLGGNECSGAIFSVEGSVPEPSTWAMLLIGFVAIGFAGYRRQFLHECRYVMTMMPGAPIPARRPPIPAP
jgi:hypothetical protein